MSEPGTTCAINWNALLKSHFRVRGSHEIYVLGCFARHVTLYSQQVRALNLIYGLCKTGKLTTGKQLAIIGEGAAGLTAAAAAAFRGAHVTLFDELEGPMELQQNNRQRWIHPYIYDWPYVDESSFEQFKEGEAGLPLLSWSAGYAANVARQISSQWELLQNAYHIDARWCARSIKLTRRHCGVVRLGWGKDQRAVASAGNEPPRAAVWSSESAVQIDRFDEALYPPFSSRRDSQSFRDGTRHRRNASFTITARV